MKTKYPTFFFYSFFCIYLLLLLHIFLAILYHYAIGISVYLLSTEIIGFYIALQ